MQKVLLTGASGYIADQLLPTFKERYEMVLVDVVDTNRRGERVEDVVIQDLIDPDRAKYASLFEGVDAVVHLGYKRRTGSNPLDHFFEEKENVRDGVQRLQVRLRRRSVQGRHGKLQSRR